MPRVVVVGAGAAGTMAAIFAASEGAETLLLERTKDGGRKILISGGGRCNILPARLDESRFVTDSSPHLLRRIVRSWPLHEQIAFFERELGLPLVEETESGKLFPKSQRARDVRDTLLAHARRKGVTIVTDTLVTDIRHAADRLDRRAPRRRSARKPMRWFSQPADCRCRIPAAMAADYRSPRRSDMRVNPTYAALTPLTVGRSDDSDSPISHISPASRSPVTITARSGAREAQATGGFLFTHQGYSGPSVLDVSHVAVRSLADESEPARITVQWTPLRDSEWEEALRPRATRTVLAAVGAELPHRLAEALVAAAGVESSRPLAQLGRAERLRLINTLVRGDAAVDRRRRLQES